MVRRLVLGCGTVGHDIVTAMAEWHGDLLVIEADEARVETLRSENVPAEVADPTDPAALDEIDWPVDIVLVAGDDPATNRAAVALAHERLGDARIIAYSGSDPTPEARDAIAEFADQILDYGRLPAALLVELLSGEGGERLRRLRAVLRDTDPPLGIVMHDNPDPDAIASATALREIAGQVGLDAEAIYFGNVSHQENRAFINLLELDLRNPEPDEFEIQDYGALALVDHSRPGVNDQLPPDTPIALVIDHHPPGAPVEADFIDLRSDVGATSTILAEYLRRFGSEPSEVIATALLYGIRVDTRDFSREITRSDFEAASFLLPRADIDILERIETPQITGDTLETIARAIENRDLRGSVLASGVGRVGSRDALAQAADQLLAMEGVDVSMVYGYRDGTVYASARSRRPDIDLGEALRTAFDQIGSAGGHADMAGAQIPLGILAKPDPDEEASLDAVIKDVIGGRFFEVMAGQRDSGLEQSRIEHEAN